MVSKLIRVDQIHISFVFRLFEKLKKTSLKMKIQIYELVVCFTKRKKKKREMDLNKINVINAR